MRAARRYFEGALGAAGAPGACGAPGIEALGAAGAGAGAAGAGATPATAERSLPHSEHTVAPAMFISPQCGHLMRSSGSSTPHLMHFSATAGLIMPHAGHVFGVDAAAGLKHMVRPSFSSCIRNRIEAGDAKTASPANPFYGMSNVVLRSRSAILAARSSTGPYSMALARQ